MCNKNDIELFVSEIQDFQEDLEKSQKRLKFVEKWNSDLPDLDFIGSFDLAMPKEKSSPADVIVSKSIDLKRKTGNKSLF